MSVCLSSFLITIVNYLCSITYRLNLPRFRDALQSFLTFDNSSIRILFHNWRRTSEGDFLVPVYPGPDATLIPRNPFVMRRSECPFPQPLRNLHFPDSLGSAHSKGLTATKSSTQLLYHQHLRHPLGSAHSKGLITSVESALTKTSPATSLECAVPKNGGGRGCYG